MIQKSDKNSGQILSPPVLDSHWGAIDPHILFHPAASSCMKEGKTRALLCCKRIPPEPLANSCHSQAHNFHAELLGLGLCATILIRWKQSFVSEVITAIINHFKVDTTKRLGEAPHCYKHLMPRKYSHPLIICWAHTFLLCPPTESAWELMKLYPCP